MRNAQTKTKTCRGCGRQFVDRRRQYYCSDRCFQRVRGSRPKPKPAHYKNGYDTRARQVREAAAANPGTLCWRCGKTLAQHPPHKNGKPARWQAGHVNQGEIGGLLLPEASTCNTGHGARLGAARSRTSPRKPWNVYRSRHDIAFCGWCGQRLSIMQAKYCSPQCSARGRNSGRSQPIPWRQCPTCTAWFVSRSASAYCSPPCQPSRSTVQTVTTECATCGDSFTYERRGRPRLYCDQCRTTTYELEPRGQRWRARVRGAGPNRSSTFDSEPEAQAWLNEQREERVTALRM